MTDVLYEINVSAANHRKRKRAVPTAYFIGFALLAVIPLMSGSWKLVLPAALIILLHYIWDIRKQRYFITSLTITPQKIRIRYLEKDEEKYIEEVPQHIEITRESWYGYRTGRKYKLVIYHNGEKIQQYHNRDWTELMILNAERHFKELLNNIPA
ncbi:hypothetical protein [Chitinophaga barathri]|uniref:Uncharacterized protein n=1 Tax=Chitinophaga barathri TaxID=1647451 RepID=A0A3N4MFD4_9BACT|nr:hypothetical protein [Chitinophaga barathri]RPD42664.1 hypothetical protein EG028_05725 [Chitinophaga barathri]